MEVRLTERSTQAVTAQSTGLPDRRVHPHTVTTGNAGGAGFMLAIDAFYIGYGLITAYWVIDDLDGIENDQQLLTDAFKAVDKSLSNGLIPEQYKNQHDLGAIINFVYQGINETGNQDITKIGINILKATGKYDPNKTAK